LRALRGAGHDIALCVTRPDRRRGRGTAVTPSPVKQAAAELGIPVSHAMDDIVGAGVELAVVVAYGRIIPPALLELVPMVNLHFSLLPRWRGAAPVERALLAGDPETGVCLMKVEEGLDTGPVYARRIVPLGEEIYLDALRAALVEVASALVVESLAAGVAGLPVPEPQQGTPTIAPKLMPAELHLLWEREVVQLHRVVRLGRAWTTFRGRRLGILRATPFEAPLIPRAPAEPPGTLMGTVVATGDGLLELEEVQPESRAAMSADDWARGVRSLAGERLGSD
jgi:methionyl-tRNA formyltransferase